MKESGKEKFLPNDSPRAAESHAAGWLSPGGTAQMILNVILVVLAGLNIYWVTSVKTQLSESSRLQEDQHTLISRRLDSADEQSARLSGEFQVTRERLGMTSDELERARAVTASLRKQQLAAVKKLNEAIAQKAGA